jgi:stringent starvation protein B
MTHVSELSTKPYLIRAIYEWCSDNGYRPYIAVVVDERTQVPFEFVRNGEIVLNVSPEATNHLVIGNDLIEFEARFNRVARNVSVPIGNVTAIYAAENGHGMAFEVPKALAVVEPKAPRAARGLREATPAAETADAPQEGAPAESPPVELSSVPSGRRRSTSKSSPAATHRPTQPRRPCRWCQAAPLPGRRPRHPCWSSPRPVISPSRRPVPRIRRPNRPKGETILPLPRRRPARADARASRA